MRNWFCFVGLGMAVSLAGCNETTGGAISPPVASAPSPGLVALPPGAPCSTEIERYETVVKADLATGNVEQQVYDKIQMEVARASNACAAGNGGEALVILASSKKSHGYRV
jgi:hypothetical protein